MHQSREASSRLSRVARGATGRARNCRSVIYLSRRGPAAERARARSVDEGLIHGLSPPGTVEALRRDAGNGLRHDHDDELLLRIDPESRARGPAPGEFAHRAWEVRHAVVLPDGEAEAETVA